MPNAAFNALRESSIFSGLPEAAMAEIVLNGRRWSAAGGDCLISAGEPGDSLLVVLHGELEVVRDTGNGEAALARLGPGAIVGEMALIDNAPRSATVRALTETEVLEITRAQFDNVLSESPLACRALVKTILRRLKSTEAMLVNQEKLAALGRISAGLAHELNNPASAVSRFAAHLDAEIQDWRQASQKLALMAGVTTIEMLAEQADAVLSESDPSRLESRSALEQADLEDELTDWLGHRGAADPWNAAANFASAGITVSQIEHLCANIDSETIPAAAEWLSAEFSIRSTLKSLRSSADRVSEIVDSVKRYSHMDRAAVERVDLNQGLETTLVILKHKMRNIDIKLDLDADMPPMVGYPAELNQVWTNLIDNAVDAMNGEGELRIQSRKVDQSAIVRITDSGAGIQPDYLSRLFEPFFTTKEIGTGTGLGLHIAYNIIVERHNGRIEVESEPGATTFTVTLPVTD